MEKKIIGNCGENIAKDYLLKKGYEILDCNWHYKHKELDIIAFKGRIIGFEVKTRKNHTDLPFTILKSRQLSWLRQALQAYCFKKGFDYGNSRLDLITIDYAYRPSIRLHHYFDI